MGPAVRLVRLRRILGAAFDNAAKARCVQDALVDCLADSPDGGVGDGEIE